MEDELQQYRTAEGTRCGGTGKMLDSAVIGRLMRSLRKAKGLGLRSMAAKWGHSAAYVSDLELGRRNWNEERIERYKKALK